MRRKIGFLASTWLIPEELFFRFSEVANSTRRVEIAHHHGQRLSIAVLALAKTHDRSVVGGIDTEMEATDAFDSKDFSSSEARDGIGNDVG